MSDLQYLKNCVEFARYNQLGALWIMPCMNSDRIRIATGHPVVEGLRKPDVPIQVSCLISPDAIASHEVLAHDWVEDLSKKEYTLMSRTQKMTLEKALEGGFLNIEYVGK